MITVYDIKKTVEEPVIGFDPAKLKVEEELNESMALSFTITRTEENRACFELIELENFIHLDADGQDYRIKDLGRFSRRAHPVKDVFATHVFFDIISNKLDKSTAINGSATFQVAMDYALQGSGWTWEVVDGMQLYALTYENFQGNSLDLFQRLQTRHKFEWWPDSQTKTVYLAKRIGEDTDTQIRYNYNMINISDNSKTEGLANIRKGYGKKKDTDEENEPAVLTDEDYDLVTVWRNQESINRYGERWGDDFENETFTIEENLLDAIAEDSKPFPVISLTAKYADLIQYGQRIEPDAVRVGNGLFIIHEPLDIDTQARILKRTWWPEANNKTPELTFGSLRPSVVKQNQATRQSTMDASKRLQNTESAIRQATKNVQTALERITQGEGDIAELSNLIVQLQEVLDTLSNEFPDLSTHVDALQDQLDALISEHSDLKAGVLAIQDQVAGTGWVNVPLSSGVTAAGATPQTVKRFDVCYISGRVTGISTTNALIGTLPANFRPSQEQTYTTVIDATKQALIRSQTNGEIRLIQVFAFGGGTVSLAPGDVVRLDAHWRT